MIFSGPFHTKKKYQVAYIPSQKANFAALFITRRPVMEAVHSRLFVFSTGIVWEAGNLVLIVKIVTDGIRWEENKLTRRQRLFIRF